MTYDYEALARRLGDGWVPFPDSARKGQARVWCYHATSGRYGAKFSNCLTSTDADGPTPEDALRKALLNARRYALITIDDLEAVSPGLVVDDAVERMVMASGFDNEAERLAAGRSARAAFNLQESK